MSLIWFALLGLVAGIIAKYLMPGKAPGGIVATIILGVLGAIIGGWIGTQIGLGGINDFDLRSLAIAVGGAVLLLYLYGLAMKHK
jgi:uncharacterized membrane protein YeaQ/YmgE (transglycosylase-associated protein family)